MPAATAGSIAGVEAAAASTAGRSNISSATGGAPTLDSVAGCSPGTESGAGGGCEAGSSSFMPVLGRDPPAGSCIPDHDDRSAADVRPAPGTFPGGQRRLPCSAGEPGRLSVLGGRGTALRGDAGPTRRRRVPRPAGVRGAGGGADRLPAQRGSPPEPARFLTGRAAGRGPPPRIGRNLGAGAAGAG